MNRLTDKGLATEYADIRAGFARNGMLDRRQLRRLGSGLGSHYMLLPGLAQFAEGTLDKFEAAGIKLVRNRVTTLRLWLQLWDTQTGHMVWESSGEGTTSAVFNHGNAVESRRLPRCHLNELIPEFHPPARLQNVQEHIGQQRHGAVSGIRHNDENIGEEELHEIAQAIDDHIDGRPPKCTA